MLDPTDNELAELVSDKLIGEVNAKTGATVMNDATPNAPPQSRLPLSVPPFPAQPGQVISLKLRLAPGDDRSHPMVTLGLTFLKPTPPLVAPPKPDRSTFSGPDADDHYRDATLEYEEGLSENNKLWTMQNPPRSFNVQASGERGEDGVITVKGKIEIPYDSLSFTNCLYGGVYSLQTPQFAELYPGEDVSIALDDNSQKAVAAYTLNVAQDYRPPTPPPPAPRPAPRTVNITGLVIEPPYFEGDPQDDTKPGIGDSGNGQPPR